MNDYRVCIICSTAFDKIEGFGFMHRCCSDECAIAYEQEELGKEAVKIEFKCGPTECDCDDKGPIVSVEDGGRSVGGSVTCSKCGESAYNKSLWKGN